MNGEARYWYNRCIHLSAHKEFLHPWTLSDNSTVWIHRRMTKPERKSYLRECHEALERLCREGATSKQFREGMQPA